MRQRSSGYFELGRPARAAMGLFTPEGERSWVPGWDPHYPTGEPSERPGTIFTTAVGGIETTWVIVGIDRVAREAAYARVTPGRHAGMVEVRCTDQDAGRCRVEVSYDITLAVGADPVLLESYRPVGFAAMLREWAELIERAEGKGKAWT